MLADYEDIKKRVKEKIKWYDENGVPRYDKFHPDLSPNIYADEVILMKISCQECGQKFLVEINNKEWGVYINKTPSLKKMVKSGTIHYGDPPRHTGCSAGDTMNCNDLEVVEFWERNKETKYYWVRKKELEIKIE